MTIRAAWDRLAQSRGWSSETASAEADRIVSAYSAPDRHYHGCRHIATLLRDLEGSPRRALDPVALQLAIIYHDLVYDSRRGDNEERSAEEAREAIAALDGSAELAERVAELVMATKLHAPADPDGVILVDLDLAILASPADQYDEYRTEIRAEYAWVPEEIYGERRSAAMKRFLERPAIFSAAAADLEAPARTNIQRELDELSRS